MPRIEGQLPFDALGSAAAAAAPLAGPPDQARAALPGAYLAAAQTAQQFNQQGYLNVLKGYQDTLAGQTDALDAVGRGYSDLSARVLAGLEGAGAAERTRIGDRYARDVAAAGQSLVSRGLGNSTVVDAANRGIGAERDRSLLDLADRLMQQRAGYTAQFGLAGLDQSNRAALANSALAQNQLGFMERVQAPYPDVGPYAQIAQQLGFAAQADRDRQAALDAARAAAPPVLPQSAGTVSRGGGGFFTQPADFSAGGTYQPAAFGGGAAPYRPPLGVVGSAAAGNAAMNFFDNGGFQAGYATGFTSPYAPPAGGGFGGGFGDQGYGYSQPAGEDQPYGQPAPAAAFGGGYSPYGNFGPAAEPAPAYNPYADLGAEAVTPDLFGYF